MYYPPTTDELPPGVPDLACYTEQCTEMGWDNTTWQNNNVPDLVMTGAPLKDTFLLPSAGYIVIRFKADNPGTVSTPMVFKCLTTVYDAGPTLKHNWVNVSYFLGRSHPAGSLVV